MKLQCIDTADIPKRGYKLESWKNPDHLPVTLNIVVDLKNDEYRVGVSMDVNVFPGQSVIDAIVEYLDRTSNNILDRYHIDYVERFDSVEDLA